MKVKGHTLVWHTQLPSLGRPHRQRRRPAHGDERPHHPGDDPLQGKGDCLGRRQRGLDRRNDDAALPFLDLLGPGYIDEAFITARAADPDARLYYNDWGTEGTSDKANAAYDMFVGMLGRAVPLDGVGVQMHTGVPKTTARRWRPWSRT